MDPHAKRGLHYNSQYVVGRQCVHSIDVQQRLGINKSGETQGGESLPLADETWGMAKRT